MNRIIVEREADKGRKNKTENGKWWRKRWFTILWLERNEDEGETANDQRETRKTSIDYFDMFVEKWKKKMMMMMMKKRTTTTLFDNDIEMQLGANERSEIFSTAHSFPPLVWFRKKQMNERRLFMLIFTLAHSRFMSKESTDSARMKISIENAAVHKKRKDNARLLSIFKIHISQIRYEWCRSSFFSPFVSSLL